MTDAQVQRQLDKIATITSLAELTAYRHEGQKRGLHEAEVFALAKLESKLRARP